MDGKAAIAATRLMREASLPAWPEALEAAAQRMIDSAAGDLRDFRRAALSALRAAGLPKAGSEDFTFVRLGDFLGFLDAVPPLAAGNAEAAARSPEAAKTVTMPTPELVRTLIFPESKDNFAVLLDGEYSPVLSNVGPGFTVGPIPSAEPPGQAPAGEKRAGPPGGVPAQFPVLLGALARETDAAAALAALFAAQPLLIQIEAGSTGKAPLQILHLRTTAHPARRDACLAIAAGRLSEATIVVRHAEAIPGDTPGKGSMTNVHTLVHAQDGAAVKWLEASPEGAGNEADVHFHKLTVLVERDARLFSATSSTGARLARNAYAVDLRGPGAEAEIHGASVLAGARQAHNHLQIRHLAPNCASRQHFKAVAADKAKASVDGTILVGEGAQLTNADQLINNLMLSDEARADSKPRLLIHADDVKCTHGATAGKLDPDQQFYLESRGLTAGKARTLLTLAFIAEVLERVDRVLGASGSGFRAHLDATLLATLKRRLGGGEGR